MESDNAPLTSCAAMGVNTEFVLCGAGSAWASTSVRTVHRKGPSKVIYDRAGSSISQVELGEFDWDRIFEGGRMVSFLPGSHRPSAIRPLL